MPAKPARTVCRVRETRLELGISQERLARACECSRQSIVSIERDETEPTIYLALRIARALNLAVTALWELR